MFTMMYARRLFLRCIQRFPWTQRAQRTRQIRIFCILGVLGAISARRSQSSGSAGGDRLSTWSWSRAIMHALAPVLLLGVLGVLALGSGMVTAPRVAASPASPASAEALRTSGQAGMSAAMGAVKATTATATSTSCVYLGGGGGYFPRSAYMLTVSQMVMLSCPLSDATIVTSVRDAWGSIIFSVTHTHQRFNRVPSSVRAYASPEYWLTFQTMRRRTVLFTIQVYSQGRQVAGRVFDVVNFPLW